MVSEHSNNRSLGNKNNFDLEERCFVFAKKCREFCKKIPRTIGNKEDSSQLIRASGSVGANYIEANEAISKKDFSYRIKISRKECRECCYWLRLIDHGKSEILSKKCDELQRESLELMKIFGSIYQKTK